MKLKYLLPLSISMVAIPSVSLISCSDNSLSPEENLIQQNLITNIAINKFAPEIKLTTKCKINEINSKIINFNNVPEKYKDASFEILNFEIPEVGSKDTGVRVKVSSKLDKSIFEEYTFNVSDSIKETSNIEPMERSDFDRMIVERYLIQETPKANFSDNVINLVNTEIQNGLFDITEEKIENLTDEKPVSILLNQTFKKEFMNKIEGVINPPIYKELNKKFYQSNLIIKVKDIISINTNNNIKNVAQVELDIMIGNSNSVYTPKSFMVNTFSTKYFNLKEKLGVLISEKDKYYPTLLIGSYTAEDKMNISDLSKNLSWPDIDPEFLIGNIDIKPPVSESDNNATINIIISSKEYSYLFEKFRINLSNIKYWDESIIDFTKKKEF